MLDAHSPLRDVDGAEIQPTGQRVALDGETRPRKLLRESPKLAPTRNGRMRVARMPPRRFPRAVPQRSKLT